MTMGDDLKYIIVRQNGDMELPLTFSFMLNHIDAAQGFRAISDTPYSNIVAAGFCRIEVDQDGNLAVDCRGQSTTLGIQSRPEDAAIIKRELNPWMPSWG